MGIAKIYGQKGGSGIYGLIQDYYAYAGESISAGDFVEFINGVASKGTETSSGIGIDTSDQAGQSISGVKLSDTKVFIAHSSSRLTYVSLHGVVLTIDGTKITVGTDVQLITTASTAQSISAEALDENRVLIAHCGYTTLYPLWAMVVTIDGTTVTAGVDKQLSTVDYTGHWLSTKLLSPNKVFITHRYDDASNLLYGMVVSVSGTTITAGTDVQLDSNTNSGHSSMTITDNGYGVISYAVTSEYELRAKIITFKDGVVSSLGSTISLNTTSYSGYWSKIALMEDNTVFIAHSYSSSYYLYGIALKVTDTGGASWGTSLLLSSSATVGGVNFSVAPINTDKALIAYRVGSSYQLYAIVCEVIKTSLIKGTQMELKSGWTFNGNVIDCVPFSDTSILILNSYNNINSTVAKYNLYGQFWGIDESNLPTTDITVTKYETQIRKAITPKIDGVAKTSGEGERAELSSSLIKNGDFEDGLENWTAQQTSYGISDIIVENGEKVLRVKATNTGQTQIIGLKQTLSSLNNTHKYYLCADIKFTPGVEGSEANTICGVNFNSFWLLGGKNGTSDWSFYSRLYTINTSYSYTDITVGIYVQSLNDIGYFKNVKMYDLTALYGAGNEPTLAWCNENLAKKSNKDIISIYTIEPVPNPTYTYVDFTSSPVPTSWSAIIPNRYARFLGINDYGNWIIESSSDSPLATAYYMFDGTTSTEWGVNVLVQGNSATNSVYAPSGVSIKPKTIKVTHRQISTDSKIQGLNEKTNLWEDLGTLSRTSISETSQTFSIVTTEYYKAFRVIVYYQDPGTIFVGELEITAGTIKLLDT